VVFPVPMELMVGTGLSVCGNRSIQGRVQNARAGRALYPLFGRFHADHVRISRVIIAFRPGLKTGSGSV
jgi:hypothetical protein